MSQDKYNKLLTIYSKLHFRNAGKTGTLTIPDDHFRELLIEIIEDERAYGIRLANALQQVQVNASVELEINDPQLSVGLLSDTLEGLLVAPKAKIVEPVRYYLSGHKFDKFDQNPPGEVIAYRSVLSLIDLLKESAAYLDESKLELIYIDDGKFILPIQYDISDIHKLDVKSIEQLLTDFITDVHRDQKLTILAKSINETCAMVKVDDRFRFFLSQLSSVYKKQADGYRLFVADFSYDKIINQLEVAKLEEIGKIHKTFSDIQNQILGIPVATIIVATQMKHSAEVGSVFWVNTTILVGCWVFAVLSWFVLQNQLHTLRAIANEINRKKIQMLEKYKPVEDLIMETFPLLESRLDMQRLAFMAVETILVIGLFISHVVYFSFTEPSAVFVKKIINYSFCMNV